MSSDTVPTFWLFVNFVRVGIRVPVILFILRCILSLIRKLKELFAHDEMVLVPYNRVLVINDQSFRLIKLHKVIDTFPLVEIVFLLHFGFGGSNCVF